MPKSRNNMKDASLSFISSSEEHTETEKHDNAITEQQSNSGKQKRGPVWRANLFLDADLEDFVAMTARHNKQSISVFVSQILREYKDNTENKQG